MAAQGIVHDEPLYLDGEFHEFTAPGDRRGSKKVWYKAFSDGRPNGWFGHRSRVPTCRWVYDGEVPDLRIDRNRIEQERQARRAAQEAAYRAAAARAHAMLDVAQAASTEPLHPYLSRKNVLPFGVFVGDWVKARPDLPAGNVIVPNTLLIPVRREGRLWSLQGIAADPASAAMAPKEFMRGGRTAGGYHAIGSPQLVHGRPMIIVCEGYATGASIHQATGHFVLVAFNCGGLKPVAEFARRARSNARIVIASDNDRLTMRGSRPWNPGVEHARAAAEAAKASVVVPTFPDLDGRSTDFNDLHAMAGLDEVAAQLAVDVRSPC